MIFYLLSSSFFFLDFTFYKVALCFIIFILLLCLNTFTLESILNWNFHLNWKVSLFGYLGKLWTIFKDANRLSSSTFNGRPYKVLHIRKYFWWQRLELVYRFGQWLFLSSSICRLSFFCFQLSENWHHRYFLFINK